MSLGSPRMGGDFIVPLVFSGEVAVLMSAQCLFQTLYLFE